ncbi:MAG: hypothetical protein HGB19_02025, partial [Chlorobiales bacterium]|nr:hypothetical protein [Chlorobiales bacterium]
MRMVRLFSFSALFFLLSIVVIPAFAQQKELPSPSLQNIDQNWLRQVQRNIGRSEYFIQWQENVSAYQSPNRAQSLRFTYYENGFKAQPRAGGDEWQAEFRLKTIDRGEKELPIEKMVLTAEENTLKASNSDFDIHYRNDEKGMRQDFIIKQRPNGRKTLRLNFATILDRARLNVNADEIVVSHKGAHDSNVMRYTNLKVWDATGNGLRAWMEKTGDMSFAIVVEDKDAVYPVTVDPLSTSPNWMAESDQGTAYFGWSVGTAGDVNGDGFSDVIVGVPLYDNGENNEGRAYVYHGSGTGLSGTPSWTAESNQASAELGISVGTAGDVNGDGYSDVIVGAYGSNNAYVYHGSGSGVST